MKLVKLFCLIGCLFLTFSAYATSQWFGPTTKTMTLWRIAKRTKPAGVNNQQMMLALVKANPQAFLQQNVNGLKAGVHLRLPALAEIKAVRQAWAIAEVEKQNSRWQQKRPQRSKLLVAQPLKTPAPVKTVVMPATQKLAANGGELSNFLQVAIEDQAQVTKVVARTAAKISALDKGQQETKVKLATMASDVADLRQSNDQLKAQVNQRLDYLAEENKVIQTQLVSLDKEVNQVAIQVAELSRQDEPTAPQQARATTNPTTDVSENQVNKTHWWQWLYDQHHQFKSRLGETAYKIFWVVVLVILLALIWLLFPGKKKPQQSTSQTRFQPKTKPRRTLREPTVKQVTEPEPKAAPQEAEYDYMGSKEGIPAKLDLARAYIEMDDLYSARQTLNEVLAEGDDEQKAEAQKLMNELLAK